MFTRSDHYFLMLNVFFLMCIVFLPFPSAVLGEYLDKGSQRQTAVAFYTASRLDPATAWTIVWAYGNWYGLVDENLHPGNPDENSTIPAIALEWWFRPVNRHALVGEQRAVVWKFEYRKPLAARRSRLGVWHKPPKQLNWP